MKHSLLLPPSSTLSPRYPWLLIFFRGQDNKPPIFFLTHGRNFTKFDTEAKRREGFEICGHIMEKQDAKLVCHEFNRRLGVKQQIMPVYQQAKSAGDVNLKPLLLDKNGNQLKRT